MEEENRNIIDYEEVIRVLPESFQNIWKENPDVLVYLSDLGSLGIQRLSQECDRLSEEKDVILEQTQDLAFHNYKTFIQAANCSHEIFQDFNIIESRLETLLKKLPTFGEKCKDFGKETQQINARWRQASSTLAKHPQLLEFLEMPQLMENYVRNELYDEALELSLYVKRLERKHTDIPLIKSIVSDVQAALHLMLIQLFEQLRTDIQLPECLKVVGYLRRLDCFNETELRIKFLQARDTWFQKVISNIDNNDTYQHVIKVIENSRIHLFDIITQYRAIFSDEDSLLLVHGNTNDCAIFHSWITWKISRFLTLLEKDLSFDLGGRVDSVLEQCMYFGLSFSRVNIDFRPLLVPIFQKATFFKFRLLIDQATARFEQSMREFTITSYTNTMFLLPPTSYEDSLQPPNCLLDFYPLAQYCNDILCAFNELKLSLSYAMLLDVIVLVEGSLKQVVKKITDIYSFFKPNMTEKENELYIKLCFQLSTELVPHLDKCLVVFFPPENISSILGMTSLEFKKLENLCHLNSKDILEPLEQILPSQNDEDLGLMLSIDMNPPQENISNHTTVISNQVSNPESDVYNEFNQEISQSNTLSTESEITNLQSDNNNIMPQELPMSIEPSIVDIKGKEMLPGGTDVISNLKEDILTNEQPESNSAVEENIKDNKENIEDSRENSEDNKENSEDSKENVEDSYRNTEDSNRNSEDSNGNSEDNKENREIQLTSSKEQSGSCLEEK